MTETREERLAHVKERAGLNRVVPVVSPNAGYPLDIRLQFEVINYINSLHEPLFVVSDICRHLIEVHGASNKTYVTGKLKLYPLVCMFLDQLAKDDMVAIIDEQEAYYKLVSFSGEVEARPELKAEEVKVKKEKKKTKEDREEAQLSLF